jgi:hypothetical protein
VERLGLPGAATKRTEAAASIVIVLVDLLDEGDEQLERRGSLRYALH